MKITKSYLKQIIKEELTILETTEFDYYDKTIVLDKPPVKIFIGNSLIMWLAESYQMSFSEMLNTYLVGNENIFDYFKRLEEQYTKETGKKIPKKDLNLKYVLLMDVAQTQDDDPDDTSGDIYFYSGDTVLQIGNNIDILVQMINNT